MVPCGILQPGGFGGVCGLGESDRPSIVMGITRVRPLPSAAAAAAAEVGEELLSDIGEDDREELLRSNLNGVSRGLPSRSEDGEDGPDESLR